MTTARSRAPEGFRGAPGSRPVQLGVLLGHGRLHQLAHAPAQGEGVCRPATERGRTRLRGGGEPALPAGRRAPDRDRTQPLHACAATARRAPVRRRTRDPQRRRRTHRPARRQRRCRHLQPGPVHASATRPPSSPRSAGSCDPEDGSASPSTSPRNRARRHAGRSGSCVARGRGSSRAVPANET